ncbi:hypothetical protein RhiirA4_469588 [Rhizophagus irregularis]|uniref:Uncharacterized protein n=1 Tax=Rhizophagus irregularis TaxID=588596 RepID=A0A2I1GZX3_9GLOM|nr:hypothetical protein RhiirA4_469588 [Rhizophagus irregularis]
MFLRKAVDVYLQLQTSTKKHGKRNNKDKIPLPSPTQDNPVSTSTHIPMTDSNAESSSNTTPKLNKFLQFQKRVCL